MTHDGPTFERMWRERIAKKQVNANENNSQYQSDGIDLTNGRTDRESERDESEALGIGD